MLIRVCNFRVRFDYRRCQLNFNIKILNRRKKIKLRGGGLDKAVTGVREWNGTDRSTERAEGQIRAGKGEVRLL